MKPEIQETGLDSVITEFGLGLIAQRGNEWYPCGTAIVIAPNLALTARHVVDEYYRKFDPHWKQSFGREARFGLLAQQVQPGKRGALWVVRQLWRSEHSDLAILQLWQYSACAAEYRWRKAVLQLLPPPIGAEIQAFGYRGGTATAKFDDVQSKTEVHWTSSPSTAVGTVVEVHDVRRDQGLYNFPCFQTDAPFDHGMSGGPIFHAGNLVGIVSGSGLLGEDGDKIAYGATLWPLLALKLQLNIAGEPPDSWYTVLDLVDLGFVRVIDRERISTAADGCETIIYALRTEATDS